MWILQINEKSFAFKRQLASATHCHILRQQRAKAVCWLSLQKGWGNRFSALWSCKATWEHPPAQQRYLRHTYELLNLFISIKPLHLRQSVLDLEIWNKLEANRCAKGSDLNLSSWHLHAFKWGGVGFGQTLKVSSIQITPDANAVATYCPWWHSSRACTPTLSLQGGKEALMNADHIPGTLFASILLQPSH